MPRLPPVLMSPHARLRFKFCPGVGDSVVTFRQSHSSSSATNWAKPVRVPCPISERTMRITQVSSGLTKTQMPTSGEVSVAWALASGFANRFIPKAKPPPAMAEVPSMKRRRDNGAIEFEVELMVLALNFDLLNQGTDFIRIHFG